MKLTGIVLCLIAPLKESLLGKYQRAIEAKQVRGVSKKEELLLYYLSRFYQI
jgi:membrane carboxypeptidase/penicillin-binding protein PbpC